MDFSVMWRSDRIPGGGMMTGKMVEITLDAEADLPEEKQGWDLRPGRFTWSRCQTNATGKGVSPG